MRQGSNSGRRPRGRTNRKQHGGGGGGGQSRTHTFDSSGPDGRVRGNARQVYEKYLGLARDASSAGDRIAAEAYYQHAEHYFRILSDTTDPTPRRPQEDRQPQHYGHDEGYYGGDDDEAPMNGHGGGQRQHEARGNGGAPQGQRDGGARDFAPRDRRPRDAAPQQSETAPAAPAEPVSAGEAPGQPQPSQAQPVQPQPVQPQPVQPQADGEAPRPRRGRPRKPRPADDGEPLKQDNTPETENGPAVS